jgi:hypothetical protein
MGHRNREIESKLLLRGADLNWVRNELDTLLQHESSVRRWGSSCDHYWAVSPTKFARVRERDGIRQLTVKSKDRGTNDNRIEVDLDCTSKLSDIGAFFKALLGPQSGTVSKSYYVWESNQSEYDTVTAYTVTGHDFLKDVVVLEFEARTQAGVDRLEQLVLDSLRQRGNITIERAPGSLYEMLILRKTE